MTTPTKSGLALLTGAIANDGVAAHGDGGLKGGAFTKVADSLAKTGHLVWSAASSQYVVTDAGRAAVAAQGGAQGDEAAGGDNTPKERKARAPRENTKQSQLITALQAPGGATIDELKERFGWQPHTVRAAITGLSKKGLTAKPTSEKVEGRGRVYRLEAAAA
jgi:hypothetical protein